MAKKAKNPGVKALRKLVDDTRASREKLIARAERTQARIAGLGDKLAAAERRLADALEARAARTAAHGRATRTTPVTPSGSATDGVAARPRRRTGGATSAKRSTAKRATTKRTTTRSAAKTTTATRKARTPRARTAGTRTTKSAAARKGSTPKRTTAKRTTTTS